MPRKSILPFDELNALGERLKKHFNADGHIASEQDCEDIIDEMFELFLLAYTSAVEGVNEQFKTDFEPSLWEIENVLNKPVEGAPWRDRVYAWYAADGTVDDILRIAETETTRIGNTAALDTATKAGATTKTWLTMLDDRVRDTHSYLEGVTVPIDADFYCYDGDHAPQPGGFEKAENNCGCRCEMRFN